MKFARAILLTVIFFSACAPSEQAIQTTMAETQQAIPTDTPVPPTVTPTSTQTPTPSPTPTITITPSPLPTFDSSVGCTDAIGCVVIVPDEPIHIAYMLTVSGPTAFLGEDSRGAIEIAINDREGMLLNRKILLTGEDSYCSPGGGATAAANIAADKTILGVVGTNCSGAAIAAMSTISGAGLVMLSPSNTVPTLTLQKKDWRPGYFRICHNDLYQSIFIAEFARNQLGASTAATIRDNSSYSISLQSMFVSRFQELGGEVTYQGAINVGDTDMRPILTKAAEDTPDILFFPVFEPEGSYIIIQSSEIAGLENATLLSTDSLMVNSLPRNSGPNVEGMYLSGPHINGEEYDSFLRKWEAKFLESPPSFFHAFAYDATNILLDAIEKVATVDELGNIYIGRQAIRDAISATKGYHGLTGSLDCGDKELPNLGMSKGDCATSESLGIYEITQNELHGDWPPPVIYSP